MAMSPGAAHRPTAACRLMKTINAALPYRREVSGKTDRLASEVVETGIYLCFSS